MSRCFILLLLSLHLLKSNSFTVRCQSAPHLVCRQPRSLFLRATPEVEEDVELLVDEDAPAGVEGAEFFGGNTRKLEFYDPVAENNLETVPTRPFERFADNTIGRRIQEAVNTMDESIYSTSMEWETEELWKDKQTKNPVAAIKASSNFFRDIKLAILSVERTGGENSDQYIVRWELAVAWPTFWEPPVVLTGYSSCIFNEQGQIVRQFDTLDEANKDLVSSVVRQILPRFWDIYHIGMTPVSEYRLAGAPAAPFKSYSVQDIPPRWVRRVTIRDTSNRSDNAAAHLPNEAFTSYLKTVGPLKESYRTVTGIAVELTAVQSGDGVDITWKIPLSVGYASNLSWDILADDNANDSYELQPARKLAVVDYNGSGPQDATVSAVRQRLYEAVVADGLPPATTEGGRPLFGFIEKTVKACYKDNGGLSMVVYEWRPQWTRPYQIYLEIDSKR